MDRLVDRLHNVEIKPTEGGSLRFYRVLIDGEEFEQVTHIAYDVGAGEIPQVTITANAKRFEGMARVIADYTPETIAEASRVLVHALSREGEMRNGLVASIKSAIREYGGDVDRLPDRIADRILGLD